MVFCPENGDPAKVKPKLYLDRSRFDAAEGQAFLLTSDEAEVGVAAKTGWESELPRLTQLLNDQEQGLPLRSRDL
jgi:putative selenate reductase